MGYVSWKAQLVEKMCLSFRSMLYELSTHSCEQFFKELEVFLRNRFIYC